MKKILSFRAENVKRLEFVEIKPDGKSVVVTGKNEQGKSSVLDSILLALQNTGAAGLRNGSRKGEVTLDLGDIIVQRRLTEKGAYLSVTSADGEKLRSPQAVLDKLTGNLTLDPLAFKLMKPSDQRELLLQAAGIDSSQIDAEERDRYDERRMAKRELESAQSTLSANPVPDDAPDAPVDLDDLLEQQEAAAEAVREADQHEQELAQQVRDLQQTKERIVELENTLQKLRKDQQERETRITQMRKSLPDGDALQSALEAITEKMRSANRINAAYEQRSKHDLAAKTVRERAEAVDRAERALEKVREKRQQAIEQADFGVAGLAVTSDGIEVDGVPFESLSSSRQMRVSTALAMAQNPELRIILIREGNFLDSDAMRAVMALADEGGYQVWIERVQDEAGEIGVHMVEGRVASIDGKPVEPDQPPGDKQDEPSEDEDFDFED